ncbi:uncharacterized protein PITG_06299 [Phytophthora infestans T30-4]|uniref:Uncharacterized protein n=1 Tax=Phytophthora infestans (strain T30-4) TaxID=403677 RepID=D0N4J4_PHYIT|nr:uncharacterized protein PITG_06299 [Phytophthora infestans T30-4]EEY69802.1 conserved hypothetical protein [Phytophthora infestans T30-4]|eukprot:XP_002998449.1 conserved hypothetical protein [Phytophthora infestans T30-4]
MQNMKSKWASAREAEGRTGNGGPVRHPKHYTIMKDYWRDATGMNNRPYLSTEDSDIILTRVRTQGECVEAGLSAVAKGFSEGLEAIGKGLASQTELLREQSERAHAQNEQLLKQLQAQSEQLSIQNGHISELLNLLQRSR